MAEQEERARKKAEVRFRHGGDGTIRGSFVLPQLQVLLCAVVWFVPMKVRTMAHCILALHMCLAWSTLDVWTVTLAVRITDLERYSLTAQEELCEDLSQTLIDTGLFPDGVPDNVCFGALGFLGTGFWWLIPASILQWVASVYVSYEGAGVIIDQVRRSTSLIASVDGGSGVYHVWSISIFLYLTFV